MPENDASEQKRTKAMMACLQELQKRRSAYLHAILEALIEGNSVKARELAAAIERDQKLWNEKQ